MISEPFSIQNQEELFIHSLVRYIQILQKTFSIYIFQDYEILKIPIHKNQTQMGHVDFSLCNITLFLSHFVQLFNHECGLSQQKCQYQNQLTKYQFVVQKIKQEKMLCVLPGRPKILYYMKYSEVKASEKATFSVLSSLRRFPFLSLCSVQYIGAFHNFAVVPTFLKYSASLLNFFVRSFVFPFGCHMEELNFRIDGRPPFNGKKNAFTCK